VARLVGTLVMVVALFLPRTTLAAEDVPPPHPFWDTTNLCLFAGVAVSRALDYTSTQSFRARGINEILLNNQIVDNKPFFGAVEGVGVALSIGASAWLHVHSHHRLERAVSVVHISITTFGALRNYNLRRH
jgi:hypothetical protein